jgi:rRNA maturation RNase YbeY
MARVKKTVQVLLEHLGYAQFDIGIWITTNATIRRFNKTYRHKDTPTDILSFPFYPELKAGEKIIATTPDEQNLGDIIISAERALKDARELGRAFPEHLSVLLVHGICHLLGYDHETDAQYELMARKERELLTLLSVF